MMNESNTKRLSEAEAAALRDYSSAFMLERARDRLLSDPDGGQHELIAASEAYAVLCAEGEPGVVDVEFTPKAIAWLRRLRYEFRDMLADQRGSSEVNENTPADTFLLFVLDGICGEAG